MGLCPRSHQWVAGKVSYFTSGLRRLEVVCLLDSLSPIHQLSSEDAKTSASDRETSWKEPVLLYCCCGLKDSRLFCGVGVLDDEP